MQFFVSAVRVSIIVYPSSLHCIMGGLVRDCVPNIVDVHAAPQRHVVVEYVVVCEASPPVMAAILHARTKRRAFFNSAK